MLSHGPTQKCAPAVLRTKPRAVSGLESRLKEAAQLGFQHAVVPRSNVADLPQLPIEVLGVATVHEALDALLG